MTSIFFWGASSFCQNYYGRTKLMFTNNVVVLHVVVVVPIVELSQEYTEV